MNKKTGCLLLEIGIVVLLVIAERAGYLGIQHAIILSFLFGFQLLLVSEIMPIIVTCMIAICVMPVIGLTGSVAESFSGFSNSVIFFVVASFGLSVAFFKVSLMKRILSVVFRLVGYKANRLILAIMICTALTSSIMSNVPACVINMMLGLKLVDLYREEQEKKRMGKVVMLAVTFSSMIGGMTTPVGSSINILAMNILEQQTGMRIGFAQWMLVGLPMVFVSILVCWWLLCRVYRPAELNEEDAVRFVRENAANGSLSLNEKKLICILGVMIVLWVASSWVTVLNVVWIAMTGCVVMLLPCIGIITIEDYKQELNLDAIVLMGTVLTVGNAIVEKDIIDFSMLSGITQLPLFFMILIVAIVVFAGLLVIPIAPSLVSILVPILIGVAGSAEQAAVFTITVALCVQNCYLLPIDTVCLITYGKGHYSMTDMSRIAICVQCVQVVLISVLMVLVHGVFQII